MSELVADDDPELAFLKHTYRQGFKEAFASGAQSLKPRERTLLRYFLVDKLSIDEVNSIYSIHRATAARWLAGAREAMLSATRRELMNKLTISKDEFESIMRLIQSDFDVSVERLLSTQE